MVLQSLIGNLFGPYTSRLKGVFFQEACEVQPSSMKTVNIYKHLSFLENGEVKMIVDNVHAKAARAAWEKMGVPAGYFNQKNTLFVEVEKETCQRNPPFSGIFVPPFYPANSDEASQESCRLQMYLEHMAQVLRHNPGLHMSTHVCHNRLNNIFPSSWKAQEYGGSIWYPAAGEFLVLVLMCCL